MALTEEGEVKERQVTLQMKSLKGRLSELEKSVADIKIRLSSVLRDDTLDNSEKIIEQEALVPLADDIRKSADRINMLNIEVNILLRKLQL